MDETVPANIWPGIVLIVILTVINGFLSCAEMAIVSANKNKLSILADKGEKKAAAVLRLLQEPNHFLSTIQVGITLSGFFSSASAATGLSGILGTAFADWGIGYSRRLAVVLITLLLSYLTLVFGELVPKRIALHHPEQIALFAVGPIRVLAVISRPFVRLLSASTNLVLRMLGMNSEKLEEKVSEEEIRSMVEAGEENGVFQEYEKEMIDSIFEFDDTLAREVMTSRTDVYAVDLDEPLMKYLDKMLASRHSRIPVYREEIDNIVGILYVKDLFLEYRKVKNWEKINVEKLLHKPFLVPETKNIDELFRELQLAKQYIAVLIDEYGGFAGIVTMEDLVEEVMGSIYDQDDEDDPEVTRLSEDVYEMDGMMTIDELNDELGLLIDSENHDTISGFIIDQLGYIPEEGDVINLKIGDVSFEDAVILDKRVENLKVRLLPKAESEKEEGKEGTQMRDKSDV
ncbi:MAG: hemolysin family protein [Lachnospiraceae bacterium]|nr:hemolysin family protein [Lachnospiraceae bacterium]